MRTALCEVKRIHEGQMVTDGAGVRINRLIGSYRLEHVDPFVLLDEIRSGNPADYVAGFPTHPHRGIETITYMIRGRFRHRDSRGGGGLLTDGCVQWMTAGKGILHSEMPEEGEGGVWGYQLWLNLPRRYKWVDPRYQHLSPDMIPCHREGGLEVRIISGAYAGLAGAASNWVETQYFDVRLSRGAAFGNDMPGGAAGLCYVHSGGVKVCGQEVPERRLIELAPGSRVEVEAAGDEAGLLFFAGRPHGEPIVRGGPFVMNTEEEIMQAFEDYRSGRLF